MWELEDAKEHLSTLIEDMIQDPEYDNANFRIELGHVFSQLNRACHRRDIREDLTDVEWGKQANFLRILNRYKGLHTDGTASS